MEKYYYLRAQIPLDLEARLDTVARVEFASTGVEDFSIDEPRVDQILGARSYSGADLPLSVISEVEELLENSEKKYYFTKDTDAIGFKKYLSEKYQLESILVEEDILDWNEEWKKSYAPIKVSDSLEIIPAWDKELYHSVAAKSIFIYPGMGFGTGGHETTYLCLKLFTKLASKLENVERCLDFGCGSGILGIALRKFYSKAIVHLYDIDKAALDNCEQNIELNDDSLNHYKLLLPKERELIEQKYNIVFANILQNVLLAEKTFLSHSLNRGGYLILSGLLNGQEDEVIKSYLDINSELRHIETVKKGDWVALLLGLKS